MNGEDLHKLLEQFSIDTQIYPKLKGITILGYSYITFPYNANQARIRKTEFIKLLKDSKIKQNFVLSFLLDLLDIKIEEKLLDELDTCSSWWKIIKQYSICNPNLSINNLSNFAAILDSTSFKKDIGAFYTPMNQVILTCKLALYSYLKNLKYSKITKANLFSILTEDEYPSRVSNSQFNMMKSILLSLRIADPSCGTGLFLVSMLEIISNFVIKSPINTRIKNNEKFGIYKKILVNLFGYDINKHSIGVTKLNLILKYLEMENIPFEKFRLIAKDYINNINVLNANFLDIEKDAPPFDIFIGNPPYLRHHGISSEIKNKFKRYLRQTGHPLEMDVKADLYIYFWLKTAIQIKENGIIAFVLSRSWYSSNFAKPIFQAIYRSIFHLTILLELPFEFWPDAEVKTHIIICTKDLDEGPKSSKLELVVWKDKIENFYSINPLIEHPCNQPITSGDISLELSENNCFRYLTLSNQKIIVEQILSPTRDFFLPIIRFDYLTMPQLLLRILHENRKNLLQLNQLGKVTMGSTTGANRYFYLKKEEIQNFKIPNDYLYPMTKSPKEWKSFGSITPNYYLLHISGKLEDSSPHVIKYLIKISKEILNRPYFKNKQDSDWYHIPLIKPDLLFPNMIYARSFVIHNRQNLHIDKQWIGFTANNSEDIPFLMVFFNSTLGILLREIQGTKTLGLGALKLSHKEIESLFTINPRITPIEMRSKLTLLYQRLEQSQVTNIIQDGSVNDLVYETRKDIDSFILINCLGYSESVLRELDEILNFEYRWRMIKPLINKRDLNKED